MSIAEPLRPKPSTAYVAKQRHSHNLSQNVEPLSAWEPPPALQGQWARGAYGMKFYTTGMINYVVSWLLYIPLMPLFALLFLLCALLRPVPKSCSGPISYGVAVGWQYLAYVCVTFGCLRHTYFSLLVMRAKQLADFLFTTSLTLSYFPYSEAVGSMDYFYFNGLYVGSYDYVRSLILDAKRERSLSLGSVALSLPRSFSPLTPVFFSTGSPYHSAWRTVFFREFTRRADVQAMLADDAAGLAAVAAPYIREWLAVGDFHTREHVSACIFRLLARILFGIETVPQSLLAAAQAFGSSMGAFTAVAPAWAHSLLCGKLQASYGEPARYGLSSYLLEHCNAAKPAALKGRPFDWAAMAAECLRSGALADDEGHRPGSGGHADAPLDPAHVRSYVQSVVDGLLFAGLIGTSTLVDTSALPRLRGVYKPEGGRPETLLSAAEHLALYRQRPRPWLLEAVRLQPPVMSSSKVTPAGGTRCPFRGAERILPEGTFVVANLYHASTDPAAWGNDAHDFKPGRPADKYLNWNGPFGGDAPRQCPGEHLSLEMGKALVDAWVEAKAPPLEA